MADYKEKLDDLQRAARRKARELDEKLGVSNLVGDTARVAGQAAKRGAKTIADGAEQLRAEANRLADDPKVRDNASRAASEAKRRAKDAGKIIRDAAGPAGKKAEKALDDAVSYATTATKLAGKGVRATRAGAAATAGVLKAKDWIKENPGKAAAVSFSLILGVRAGVAFPGIDAVLLGSHPHWLTHSALPVWGLCSLRAHSALERRQPRDGYPSCPGRSPADVRQQRSQDAPLSLLSRGVSCCSSRSAGRADRAQARRSGSMAE